MADIGFEISGTNITTATIRPDNDLQRKSTPKVRKVKFGHGYEQRGAVGINNIEETYSVRFKNREKAAADDIIKFFEDKAGVTSFSFTIPDSNSSTNDSDGNPVTTVKVVCDTYSIKYANANHYDVSATFRRVYGV
jgi:phage-related protein|tara:strand:- start:366 stop:773 length:408 start_codon:yes stop_codon:yes gene_type:complete